MAYLLSNIYIKNYWNPTTIVEIIVGGWVVSFFLRHNVCQCELANGMLTCYSYSNFAIITEMCKTSFYIRLN